MLQFQFDTEEKGLALMDKLSLCQKRGRLVRWDRMAPCLSVQMDVCELSERMYQCEIVSCRASSLPFSTVYLESFK